MPLHFNDRDVISETDGIRSALIVPFNERWNMGLNSATLFVKRMKEDQLAIFDALSYYKRYTDIMDIDDVPEAERKETAKLVLDHVLKAMQHGGPSVCGENNTEHSCCSCGQEPTVNCCG